jgi:hypothetical protein
VEKLLKTLGGKSADHERCFVLSERFRLDKGEISLTHERFKISELLYCGLLVWWEGLLFFTVAFYLYHRTP